MAQREEHVVIADGQPSCGRQGSMLVRYSLAEFTPKGTQFAILVGYKAQRHGTDKGHGLASSRTAMNPREVACVRMPRRLLIAVFVVLLVQPSRAQVAVSPGELAGAVHVLALSVGALPAQLRSSRLADSVGWLQNNVGKTRAENVTLEYARSLERAAAVLAGQPSAAVVEDVTRELEAKVAHCKRLGVGMGGRVSITVNTKRGGRVVNDWGVLYQLKFDEWLKTPPRNFLRLSSPTQMNVEPGRYWIWARETATGRTSERFLVEVAGQTQFAVDLPVP